MAKGVTTDVYPRDNCIAPDIVFIVWTTNTKSACARVGVASGRDGRMIDLRLPFRMFALKKIHMIKVCTTSSLQHFCLK